MSTVAIIAIVIGALILIALIWGVMSGSRRRRHEERRQVAGRHREEAEHRHVKAEKHQAAADEKAAAARREAAEAEERAVAARHEREVGDAHREHAREIDPDRDSEPSERQERRDVAETEEGRRA
jgi:F0F1-type ATP synthase membrane subunit b/b'